MAQLPDNNDEYDLGKFFNGGNDDLKVLTKNKDDGYDEVKPADALAGADVIAIYFSAHWCPVRYLSTSHQSVPSDSIPVTISCTFL